MALPDRQDRVSELLELEDERDRLEAERKETAKEARDEIRRIASRIYRIRQILAGRETEDLPGTGGVHLKREQDAKVGKPPKRPRGEPLDALVGSRKAAVESFKKAQRKAGGRRA